MHLSENLQCGVGGLSRTPAKMQAQPLAFPSCLSESHTKILVPTAAHGRSPMTFLADKIRDLCPEISQCKGNFRAERTACSICTHSGCFFPGVTLDEGAQKQQLLPGARCRSEPSTGLFLFVRRTRWDSTGVDSHGWPVTAKSPGSCGKLTIATRVEIGHTFTRPV